MNFPHFILTIIAGIADLMDTDHVAPLHKRLQVSMLNEVKRTVQAFSITSKFNHCLKKKTLIARCIYVELISAFGF